MSQERVPPGQHVTERFPVLHHGGVPKLSKEAWTLKVYGEVEEPLMLDYRGLLALPRAEVVVDIHCVTMWSKLGTRWEGVRLSDLFALVGPTPKARYAIFEAEQGWTTNLPMEALEGATNLLAYRYEGEELPPQHGGPVRALIPGRYFWKSAKWVRGICLRERDEPGFWEVRGYHNSGDPWREERYGLT